MNELFDLNEWGPPLAVMLTALTGGAVLSTRLGRRDAEAESIEREGARLDLENRCDEALQQLAALETQRSMMNPEDYAAERKALLALGSEAMRKLDQGANMMTPVPNPTNGAASSPEDEAIKALTQALKAGEIDHLTYAKAIAALGSAPAPRSTAPTPAAAPPPTRPTTPERSPSIAPAWQGGIYALVGIGLIGGLLYFIQDASEPRRDGAGMTGNQALGTAERPPAGAPGGRPAWVAEEMNKAEEALKANENDIAALNTLTQLNLNNHSVAWEYNQKAREVAPTDADARMFEAVITSIMGMPEKSQEKFDALLKDNPEHAGAWAYKGLTLMEAKRFEEAAVALQKAKDLGLADHAIDNALAAAKNGGVNPRPAGMPAPSSGGSSAILVKGTIDIDPNRSTFKAQKLFVNLSDPNNPGPPMAALKLPPGPFPMDFVVTEANKIPMMGDRPIPANFTLKVRLDDDGNAFTRAPTDPQAVIEGMSKGTQGVKVLLK